MADSPIFYRLGKLVAEVLPDVAGGQVLVGCSGGADSLALAAVTARVARLQDLRVGAVVVDHQLQPGSDEVARTASRQCEQLGLAPVEIVAVQVDPSEGGLEAAARKARYAALEAAADRHRAAAVLLAHTRDDQAETVLLGLARGSGARSIAGMSKVSGRYRRPFLDAGREDTERLCADLGLTPHDDPQNADERFARVRVRHQVVPALTGALGKPAVDALARTAHLLQADNEALDQWSRAESHGRITTTDGTTTVGLLQPSRLADLPAAIRTRILRRALLEAGVPADSLTSQHIAAADALVARWKGQGPARVPGDREVARKGSQLVIYPAPALQSHTPPT